MKKKGIGVCLRSIEGGSTLSDKLLGGFCRSKALFALV